MAQNSGTSEASINRCCKKLGFKSFNSFKIALAQENFFNSMKERAVPDGDTGLIATVSRDYSQMLVNTSAMLDTSYASPKLNDLADYKFITSDKITACNSLALSNNLLFLYVEDVLYSALLQSDKALRQKKLNSDAILGSGQMVNNYMLEKNT